MDPDTTWNGILVPVFHSWLPTLPLWLVTLIVTTLVSIGYGLMRKNPEPTVQNTPNPIHVLIPATIGTVLGGWPGLILGAAGDGVRRAGGALFVWIGKRIGIR